MDGVMRIFLGVKLCVVPHLFLNVPKPKDLSTDARKESVQPQPNIIYDETVESVDHFKHLGMVMDSKLTFSKKCDMFQKGSAATALSRKTQIF